METLLKKAAELLLKNGKSNVHAWEVLSAIWSTVVAMGSIDAVRIELGKIGSKSTIQR